MTLRDIALAILVMAAWGLHYAVIRIGALEIPPFMLLSIRFFLCALIFLPFARRISIAEFKNVMLYALPFQGLHMGLLFAGLAQVDAGLAALIMKAGVPFSILLGWIVYKERFGIKTFAGLIIAFTGGIMIFHEPDPQAHITYLGIAFLLGSALFWAVGSIRLKYISDLNFPTMITYAFGAALPFAVITSALFENNHLQALGNANHATLALVLAYQVIVISLSHYWWKCLIGRNPLYLVTPFSILTPIFGVVFGIMLLGETLSVNIMLGGSVSLLGITIITVRKAQRGGKQQTKLDLPN